MLSSHPTCQDLSDTSTVHTREGSPSLAGAQLTRMIHPHARSSASASRQRFTMSGPILDGSGNGLDKPPERFAAEVRPLGRGVGGVERLGFRTPRFWLLVRSGCFWGFGFRGWGLGFNGSQPRVDGEERQHHQPDAAYVGFAKHSNLPRDVKVKVCKPSMKV